MEDKLIKLKKNNNVLNLMQCREINTNAAKLFRKKSHFTDNFIKRLGLEAELEGHQGCVNCLQWSPNGRHLASGSDDTNIILWDPFRHKKLNIIPTPHIGNIFSVKFLADENTIASAAGDCRVVVQNVNGALARKPPLLACACHLNRVKRLATTPELPTVFWSAGEDGFVLQFDLREPHECPSQCKVLIDLYCKSEIKCIAVNPTKPYYIAVGVNDCFVRLFDRRMLKITTLGSNYYNMSKNFPPMPINPQCVQYYAPGHLVKENSDVKNAKLAVTYIAFNSSGSEMLVNVGGEQIYLYDVNKIRHVNELRVPQILPKEKSFQFNSCCANYCFGHENGINNIVNSSKIDCACFYMHRAFKYYERKWMSDLYGAARDYLHVIQTWPNYIQAYIGLIKCLIALKWLEEANIWLKHFLKLHPNQENTIEINNIKEELLSMKSESLNKTNTTTTTTIITNSHNDDDITSRKVIDDNEKKFRLNSIDYEKRYLGHCNTTTDIKEANFLGLDDNFICAGSDEGIIFFWEKKSMEIVNALFGDNSIVNCIQPHPSTCVIASSGIDPFVKLWSPSPEDGKTNIKKVKSIPKVIETNQQRMYMDPFESMLASMGYQLQSNIEMQEVPTCRTS